MAKTSQHHEMHAAIAQLERTAGKLRPIPALRRWRLEAIRSYIRPTRRALAVLALTLVGCYLPPHQGELSELHQLSGPDLQFTIDAEHEPALLEAVRRWNAAADLDLTVGPDGIPIVFVPQAFNKEGQEACAVTFATWTEGHADRKYISHIEIATDPTVGGCGSVLRSLLHELAHAIAPNFVHTEACLLASHYNRGAYIGIEALLAVCAWEVCGTLNPEPAP